MTALMGAKRTLGLGFVHTEPAMNFGSVHMMMMMMMMTMMMIVSPPVQLPLKKRLACR